MATWGLAGDPQPVPADELFQDVQADILKGGIPKRFEIFQFFTIKNAKEFCQTLHLDTTLDLFKSVADVYNLRQYIQASKGRGLDLRPLPVAIANISFTAAGLREMQTVLPADSLGLTEDWEKWDPSFFGGMEADAEKRDPSEGLRDPMDHWEDAYKGRGIHGVFLVAGSNEVRVRSESKIVAATFGTSVTIAKTESGAVRPGKYKGREHFGYNDNISQPTVEGVGLDNPKIPDGSVGKMGEKWNTIPQSIILVQNPHVMKRPKWTKHGSYLVFRKLEQDVGTWREKVVEDAAARGISNEKMASKLMGRWFSGCPVMVSPDEDDPTQAFNNTFDLKEFPQENLRSALCPYGAHIRKMNPHRAQVHASTGDVVRDGRMLRRGIPYGTDFDTEPESRRGLHFVCYQSRIEDGFKTLQREWANFTDFPGPGGGVDSTMGNQLAEDVSKMFIWNDSDGTEGGNFVWKNINPFVTPRGGEYFFTPSLPALRTTLSLEGST